MGDPSAGKLFPRWAGQFSRLFQTLGKMRNHMKILFLIFFGALLAGCGTKTSEIIPSGNDTYFISGHGYAQKAPEAMTGLYKEANTYCHNIGKKFVSVSTDSQSL